MFIGAIVFAMFGKINSYKTPTVLPKCSEVKFGSCLINNFCSKTANTHKCLPCPALQYCPGDGYKYQEQPKNNNAMIQLIPLTHDSSIKKSYYIASDTPSQRQLLKRLKKFKKLKKLIKIVKVGLKVAAVVKTGGAPLKIMAAAKIKQIAIKKGLQCLKNGLSNFCKGGKKTKISIPKKMKTKSKIGEKNGSSRKGSKKITTIPKKRANSRIKPTKTTSARKQQKSRSSSRIIKKTGKRKGKIKRAKHSTNTKKLGTKKTASNSKTVRNPCTNVFDNIANKVNNVTNHIAYGTVNKGRDWLKNRFGGNSPECNQGTIVKRTPGKRPTNLRGGANPSPAKKPRSKSGSKSGSSSSGTDDSNGGNDSTDVSTSRPTNRRRRSNITLKPITSTDDSTDISTDISTARPTNRRRRSKLTLKPTTSTDDSVIVSTARPTNRRRRSRPTNNPSNLLTRMPARRQTRVPINRPTRDPTAVLSFGPTKNPIPAPTQAPTRIPSFWPTRIPTQAPTQAPTRIPSPLPTHAPTARPTLFPTPIIAPRPTMIAGINWGVFSSAPTIKSNIPPTIVPTISMFSILSAPPTSRSTPTPSNIRETILSTQVPSTLTPSLSPTPAATLAPSATPSFRPSPTPSLAQQTSTPSSSGVGASSVNSASTTTTTSPTIVTIASVVACAVILIIVVVFCVYVTNKSKRKMTPFQKWTTHYADKPQNPIHNHNKQIETNEDIHHFYSKSGYIPTSRPSINQNTVFIPHVSSRASLQASAPIGAQKSSKRLSIVAPNHPL